MAAVYEALTLCSLQGVGVLQGVEAAGDGDRVLLTEAERTVTLYKVSDQRPLGSWAVKQGQRVTCPAVYNAGTGECVVIHDDKVLRMWKEEDDSLQKVFKTTLSAEVCRIHSLPDTEPLVLFRLGSVRQLNSLLADPRQDIENVLSPGETIKWSEMFLDNGRPLLMIITEKDSDFYVNIWRPSPGIPLRYKLQEFTEESRILNFTASLKKNACSLLILYSSGHVCQSLVPLVQSSEEAETMLSMTSLLRLPEPMDSGALTLLDDTHLATLTPSAMKQKDLLCIWNTSFQTMQECKEFSQNASHQLWNHDNALYVPCRSKLQVLRYKCEPSSLASALGKASDARTSALETPPIVSWEDLTRSKTTPAKHAKKASRMKRGQDSGDGGCLSDLQSSSESQISSAVRKALSAQDLPLFQISAGKMVRGLVDRSRSDPKFYPQSSLIDLIATRKLSYSLCPDLMDLGLEKSDVRLLQQCLRCFIDVPEAIVCACLKTFLSVSEEILCDAILDTTSAASYMEAVASPRIAERGPAGDCVIQNGFSPGSVKEDGCDMTAMKTRPHNADTKACPVSLRRAALLNTVLASAYSETYLLPHLKDLTSDQVILFLRYLHFLYKTCSQQITLSLPGQEELSVTQVIDWMNLLLDANFTILVVMPKAKSLLRKLQKCVRQQMSFYSELNMVAGSLSELQSLQKPHESNGRYTIEVLELY
ncbi:nucleolar protein 11 [Mantella aurantiaca]